MHFNTHYQRRKGMLGVCGNSWFIQQIVYFKSTSISATNYRLTNLMRSLPEKLCCWVYDCLCAESLVWSCVFQLFTCSFHISTQYRRVACTYIHTYNFCLCSPAHTNALSIQLKAAQSIIMTSAWQFLLLLLLVLLLSYVQLGEACLQWCFLPTMRLNVTGQWSSACWYSCWGRGRGRVIRHDSYALVYAAAKFPAKVVVWLCGCKLQNNKITI